MHAFSPTNLFKLVNIAFLLSTLGTTALVNASKIDFLLNDQNPSKRKGIEDVQQPSDIETTKKQKITEFTPLFARAHVDIGILRNFPKYIQKVGLYLAGQSEDNLGTDTPSKIEQQRFYNAIGSNQKTDYGLPGPLTQTLRALACQDISERKLAIYDMPLTILPAHMTRFKQITELVFTKTLLVDITALGVLRQLRRLVLTENPIKNISVLKSLDDLTFLNLSNNQIEDIKPLESLLKLKRLYLSHNPIKVLPAFAESFELHSVRLDHTQIEDISAFVNKTTRKGPQSRIAAPNKWRTLEVYGTPFALHTTKDPEIIETLYFDTPVRVVCKDERAAVKHMMH